jgi:diacylglycerol O-acyltransferase
VISDGLGLRRAGRRPSTSPPPRWVDGVRQLGLGLLVWAVYLAVQALPTDRAAADRNGAQLLAAERWLHIDLERWTQRPVIAHPWLGTIAAWEYATLYILTTFAVLGWVWWRAGSSYRWLRNVLAWTTLGAMVCFALWPATPPRLLAGQGFTDIVVLHHPPLSWGSSQVSAGADQFAAMPSLHVAWALWVGLAVVVATRDPRWEALGVLHVALTVFVVLSTANHYLLDVLAAGALVGLAALFERLRARVWAAAAARPSSNGVRVAAPDEFFLHVESASAQQPVGGFVMLRPAPGGPPLTLADFRELMTARLGLMPRFSERLRPAGWLRHARWVPAEVDLDRHVCEHRLPGTGDRLALAAFVSGLSEQQFDRSKPMWQLWFVPNAGAGESAVVAVMHHCFADGLGVVDILRNLFDPTLPLPDRSDLPRPSRPARLAVGAVGLLGLAADGTADRLPLRGPLSGRRVYSFAMTPLEPVRQLARLTGTRITDVLLASVGQVVSGLSMADGDLGRARPARLRAAVPMTTRVPAPAGTGRRAQPGNLTAALRLDVPLEPLPPLERLRRTARAAEPRRRSGRAIATTFVMRVIGLLPPALHRQAARAMYNGRFFAAIVSNMPGPSAELTMGGGHIQDVYPILPLAAEVPLGVGTLGWNGQLCLSAIADPARVPDAGGLAERMVEAIEDMVALVALVAAEPRALDGAGPAADQSGPARDGRAEAGAPR